MDIASPEIAVSIHNLTRKFKSFTAVDHVSFDVLKGEIFGFLGPNGAGKTTTINMICGLLPSTEGSVGFHRSDTLSNIKSYIGYCPQDNIFFPRLTCLEQLVFMGEMYGIQHRIAMAGSQDLLDRIGLKDKRNVLAGRLSGGMKRRLSICLALVHNPEILILDEPEAGLDPQSRILVRDFIKSFRGKRTILLTTHNMDEADRLADRIAVIDYGKLLLLDTPENLKKTIGEGDLLEIYCNTNDLEKAATAMNSLLGMSQHTVLKENSLIIKSKQLIDRIPAIVELLRKEYIDIDVIKIRENTLEDVFIHLTGRNLRE